MSLQFRRALLLWMTLLTLGNVGALAYARYADAQNDALFGGAICTTTARGVTNIERLTQEGVLSTAQATRQIQDALEFADDFTQAGYCQPADKAKIDAARIKYIGQAQNR